MPLFAIVGYDAPGAVEKRVEHMESHCQALATLKAAGRLFSAGLLFNSVDNSNDYAGSILIIDFASHTEAVDWFATEPYNVAGVYSDVTIHPYIDAMDFIDQSTR